ncbi:MAG: segregation/condensation protein A [Actinomycetia bacterium]|nr:segregation/condensation protein A [Actinomycetes bacterium]
MKEEIDLLEVPLFEVISAYLEDMETAGVVDYWDEMTEFLLLMSLLVEIKSRLLLPGGQAALEEEMTPEEARDRLLARLFEYSKFKAAAVRLRELGESNAGCVFRPPVGEAVRRLAPLEEIVGTGDAMELRDGISRLLEGKAEPDTSHITQIKVELQRQIRIIRGVLAKRSRFSFNRIFGGEQPLVQALSIFALLDLLSRGEIRVSQAEPFGDIVVRARGAKTTG